ncbi:MAG: molybdopterin-containing oxidoreductase family protein [Pseudomonadales bacterium]
MATKTVKTYCRFCHAYCPMEATVEDNRLIALVPDTSNEMYGGYTCIKGRQMIDQIDHPTRLQQSQKKQPDGSFNAIGTELAMDEIATQLQTILDTYGPRSIASYNGTYSYQNSAAHDVARAFHAAIDSPSYYTSVTIDQPAKVAIGPTRMGWWNGGSHMWNDSDVAMIIGNNTLVSHFSIPGGIPAFSPHNALRDGKKRGIKVICIDPRVTEVASRADLHLQVRPGQDAAILAAIIAVIQSLNAICGRHYREGERLPNPGVLTPTGPRSAEATGPQPQWLTDGVKSRVSEDICETVVLSPYGPLKEMPTAVISDEMLLEGEGQIKALICVGGNPLLAWPDQEKTHAALSGLELLVCIDIKMAATAQMADYVLAPKMCLEREDVTLLTDIWHDKPYSQYTQTVVEAEGDKIEEWEFFWAMGKRMGLNMSMANGPINMQEKPKKFDLLANITQGSRVPLQEIYNTEGGKIFDVPDVILDAPDPTTRGRLQLFPPGLEQELEASHNDMKSSGTKDYPLLLISRRMKNTYNSTGPELSLLKSKGTTNPAFMHPQELAALQVADGDIVEVHSLHGSIPAVVTASDDIRPGVISMSHCWGGSPDPTANADQRVREIGSNTNRLIDNLENAERYSGMCRQSSIPVAIRKLS